MAPFDINRLRLQHTLGGMDYGMNMGGMGVDYGPQMIEPPIIQDMTTPIPDEQVMDPRVPNRIPAPSVMNPQEGGLQKTLDAINQIYTPETTSRDRFNTLLDAYPERQEPNWARKLVASGMGLGARRRQGGDPIKTMESVMYAPHMRDVADWTQKSGPFQQAAQLENTANINERTLAGNVVTAQTQADKLASNERIANEKNRIAEMRAEAYGIAQRAKANGYTIKILGDRVVGFKPNGEKIDLGSSGGLNERDKIILEGEWDVKQAEASGKAALDRATVGNYETVIIDGKLHIVDPTTKQVYPVTGAPTGQVNRIGTPGTTRTNTLEDRRLAEENMRTIFDTRSTGSRWITRDSNGRYTMKRKPVVTEGRWGPFGGVPAVTQDDVNEWEAVWREVYPNTPIPGETKGVGPSNAPTDTAPAGRGLGPSTTPGRGTLMQRGGGLPGQAERDKRFPPNPIPQQQPVKTQSDAANPMHKRGVFPDGSVKESFDGGKTWK